MKPSGKQILEIESILGQIMEATRLKQLKWTATGDCRGGGIEIELLGYKAKFAGHEIEIIARGQYLLPFSAVRITGRGKTTLLVDEEYDWLEEEQTEVKKGINVFVVHMQGVIAAVAYPHGIEPLKAEDIKKFVPL